MLRPIRLGRHPLHPAFVHFPIALWTVTAGTDLAAWMSGQLNWWPLSEACLGLGVISGLLAMAAGALDYAALPRQHPAQDTAVWHMLSMGAAWCLFVICWVARGTPGSGPPLQWTIVVELIGFAVMVFGGWMGGQLVYHHGVGVGASSRDATL
jgi:uncharacterized membrane protein